LVQNAEKIEAAFWEGINLRLNYERTIASSPGLLGVILIHLLMPLSLGGSLIGLFRRRRSRSHDKIEAHSEEIKKKAIIDTNFAPKESLYIRVFSNLDDRLSKKILGVGYWYLNNKITTVWFSIAYITTLSMLLFSVADEIYEFFPSWLIKSESVITALHPISSIPYQSMLYGLLFLTLPFFFGKMYYDGFALDNEKKIRPLIYGLLLALLLLHGLHWLALGENAFYYVVLGLYGISYLINICGGWRNRTDPITWWWQDKITLKNDTINNIKDIQLQIEEALAAELCLWSEEISDTKNLIEDHQPDEIRLLKSKLDKLKKKIDLENNRWKSLSAIDQLAEIKASEEIKLLINQQKTNDRIAQVQADAAETQTDALRDTANAQARLAQIAEHESAARERREHEEYLRRLRS
jgi:hypothetical protein